MKITEDAFIGALSPEWRLIAEANRMSKQSFDMLAAGLRNAALEEAAQMCEEVFKKGSRRWEAGAVICADQIRALKTAAVPEQ